MSLELKNVEKKIGLDTHIYPTNLKLQKNTINILLGADYWLKQPGSPKAKRNEKPKGKTVPFAKAWN